VQPPCDECRQKKEKWAKEGDKEGDKKDRTRKGAKPTRSSLGDMYTGTCMYSTNSSEVVRVLLR
jgi:hypothetical protein